ncbi:MAG: glycosyltransferase family 4 protein [Acidimicrobiales bacterium]|nr:glycosyltransferase family 4 protein [Acidimicrobiales bacterium]MCB9373719.1 glycosyltransferase family 4 protein [Microthrixaceae bacterium]
MTAPEPASPERLARLAEAGGIRRVHLLAWRDLDDPEAGGSEQHASQLARHWAGAGLDVTLHTGAVAGRPARVERDGFHVVRGGGHLSVFPRTVLWEWSGRAGPRDGLVDIFHGITFFSPLWARGPRVGFVHHVHLGTWPLRMPPGMAQLGHFQERVLQPLVYRRATLVTPSEATRREVIDKLGMRHADIRVAPNGVDPRFRAGGTRSAAPLVLAVGRLVPHKGFDAALRAIATACRERPGTRVEVVGDGPARPDLERLAVDLGLADRITFRGRVDDAELVAAYQRAWVVANASLQEGWGLTLTEAAACGTPAVATRIPGHTEAVADGESGLLVDGEAEMAAALGRVLDDAGLRARLAAGATRHAARFTWAASAETVLRALVDDAARRR